MTMQGPATPFTFQQPGNPRADSGRSTVVNAAPKKRCGIVPMRPASMHKLAIGGKEQTISARDRRAFPHASGKFFCTAPGCFGKFHDTFDALARAHEPQTTLEAREEVHLFGFWSNDPCNTRPDPNCEACKAASAEATKTARAKDKAAPEVAACCAEHSGGVVGLLTPTDPHAPSS